MKDKGVRYFLLSMVTSGILGAIVILNKNINTVEYDCTVFNINEAIDYNKIEAFSQQKPFVMNKEPIYSTETEVPITNFAEMSKITYAGQTEAESMLETTYSAAMPFAEKKTTGVVSNAMNGFAGFFGSRSTADNNSDEEYAQNTTMYIDHSNITNQLKTMGLNTDMEEDPFEPGGGEDNEGHYNDVPVGDGLAILMLLAGIYVCIKRKESIIHKNSVTILSYLQRLAREKNN